MARASCATTRTCPWGPPWGARPGEARSEWIETVSLLQPLAGDGRDPRLLAPLAQALLGLGRRDEALPVIDRLRAGGYRRAPFVDPVR